MPPPPPGGEVRNERRHPRAARRASEGRVKPCFRPERKIEFWVPPRFEAFGRRDGFGSRMGSRLGGAPASLAARSIISSVVAWRTSDAVPSQSERRLGQWLPRIRNRADGAAERASSCGGEKRTTTFPPLTITTASAITRRRFGSQVPFVVGVPGASSLSRRAGGAGRGVPRRMAGRVPRTRPHPPSPSAPSWAAASCRGKAADLRHPREPIGASAGHVEAVAVRLAGRRWRRRDLHTHGPSERLDAAACSDASRSG